MSALNVTTGLLGLALAAVIVLLLRRDHLYVMHALFWVVVAGVAVVLGLWPGLIDRLAAYTGIFYPPALLLLVGLIVLMIKALYADMLNTRLERDLRRLNQRVAMLEATADGRVEHLGSQQGTTSGL
ncbi:MAG: DUF2304 domain-containing protein [Rubrivivax sp.]|nr:DUF2304 domain-containing protein [Rubrivivax sp.]